MRVSARQAHGRLDRAKMVRDALVLAIRGWVVARQAVADQHAGEVLAKDVLDNLGAAAFVYAIDCHRRACERPQPPARPAHPPTCLIRMDGWTAANLVDQLF